MAEPFLKIGERLTDYVNVDVTVQCLMFGGFGVVAVCRDETQPERPVVMKTLLPHLMRQAETRRMFVREALIWKGVCKHANILPLLSVTKIAGRPYLKLLYADEVSLRDHLRAGVPSMVQAITWAQHIAAGLAHLHAPDPERLRPEPLVHRDLKPENVLIASGRVRNRFAVISDFGLAKAVESSAATSVGTMGLGSAHEPDSTGVRETSSQLVHNVQPTGQSPGTDRPLPRSRDDVCPGARTRTRMGTVLAQPGAE